MIHGMIGWVRDRKGIVIRRTFKGEISNAITTLVAGGHMDKDGLANTTPYIFEVYELKNDEEGED